MYSRAAAIQMAAVTLMRAILFVTCLGSCLGTRDSAQVSTNDDMVASIGFERLCRHFSLFIDKGTANNIVKNNILGRAG